MDERKRRVLQAIIDDYVRTAEPVGSRAIARRHGLGVSSATIRNEMADLEEMGYLEQPHTSAGRVPSDKGYRYYVDCLLSSEPVDRTDVEVMRRVLELKARRIYELVRQSAHLLSEATQCLALATAHVAGPARLCALQVVRLGAGRLLLLMVGDDGSVHSRFVDAGEDPSAQDMERISRVLSQRLAGAQLGHAGLGQMKELENELGRFRGIVDEVFQLLSGSDDAGERVLVDGATKLLRQPEFQDVAKAQSVLDVLEGESFVEELLGMPALGDGGVGVVIGREIQVQEMADCSLVTALYAAPGRVAGRIGVLGPRRMDYNRVISLVEGVVRGVNELLDGGPPRPAPRRSARRRGGAGPEGPRSPQAGG
jgi:heat-inducible transcriptional repressor